MRMLRTFTRRHFARLAGFSALGLAASPARPADAPSKPAADRHYSRRFPQRLSVGHRHVSLSDRRGRGHHCAGDQGAIGTKGPRVTTNLVLPGRFLVLLPNSDQSGISRKIENLEERKRLKKILRELHIPDGMGVIMRTAGEGQQLRYFVRDLACCWRNGTGAGENQRQPMATCVFQEPDLIERTVRDFLTEDVERIVVDNPKAHDRMREMISRISKRSASKIKLYSEAQPVFDRFNVSKQLENTFTRQVHLKSGGYIVIDETEALVAIDVNTGRHKGGKDQEALILKVNLEAAEEICRQLRLRNMGGLIVLDFIDMKSGPRPATGPQPHARGAAPRQGQDPHPPHFATGPHGNDPPAPQRKRTGGRL